MPPCIGAGFVGGRVAASGVGVGEVAVVDPDDG